MKNMQDKPLSFIDYCNKYMKKTSVVDGKTVYHSDVTGMFTPYRKYLESFNKPKP